MRSSSPRALCAGLAVALGLHVLGIAALALRQWRLSAPGSIPVALRPAQAPLTWFEALEEPRAASADAQAGGGESEPAGAAARPQTLRRPPATGVATVAVSPESADSAGEPSGEEAVAGAPDASPATQPLSLDALGVGPGHNPFLLPSARRSSARALGQRIDHVLRSGLAEHDQQLGLGPEGPAIAAVTDLVMQSTTAPNSDALLVLRSDGKGETLSVEVAEASRENEAWNAVARSLLRALQGKKLRVPAGSGGVTMQLRVVSHEQLPSGRDPGLALDLFGQEVKAGAGPKSTRVQLLTPKIVLEQYQISSTDPRVKIPVIGVALNILGVQGDLVDIASVARRVVHAHLVSLETHPPDPQP